MRSAAPTEVETFFVDLSRAAVPIFLVLFGFFIEKSRQTHGASARYLSRRFAELALPFLCWSIFYYVLFGDWRGLSWILRFSHCFSGYAWPGQYFFIVLFQLIPLAPLISRLARSHALVTAVALLTLVLYLYGILHGRQFPLGNHLAIRPFVYWIVYPLFGASLALRSAPMLHPIAAVSLLTIPCEAYLLRHSGHVVDPYLTPTVLVASLLAAAALIPCAVSLHGNSRSLVLIAAAGRNSMAVFLLNPLFAQFLGRHEWLPHSSAATGISYHLATALIIVGLCVTTAFIARRTGLEILIAPERRRRPLDAQT